MGGGGGLYCIALFKLKTKQKKDFMAKPKDKFVSTEAAERVAEVMTDAPIEIKLGGKKHIIRALRPYSKYRIFSVYNKMAKNEADNIEKIMREVATNLEYSAEIVAIILCNDKFSNDVDANDKLVDDKKLEVLLNSESENEWVEIVFKALNSLVVESVFTITALSDLMTTSLRRRKDETRKAMNLGQ